MNRSLCARAALLAALEVALAASVAVLMPAAVCLAQQGPFGDGGVPPGHKKRQRSVKALAGQILSAKGVRPGLVVHLGCGDGSLAAELSAGGKNVVHALCFDRKGLEAARLNIQAKGIYGKVSVDHVSLARLPYADDLVNLLVVDRLAELQRKGLSLAEVMRVLCPGGVAYLGSREGGTGEGALKAVAKEAGAAEHGIVKTNGLWVRMVKGRPEGADEWTHFEYDAARTSVSGDARAGVPSGLRWVTGSHWPDKDFSHRGDAGFVSAGGRNFYWYTQASRRTQSLLTCRDAYNGLLLWEKRIDRPARATLLVAASSGRSHGVAGRPGEAGRPVDPTIRAAAGRVYVHLGGPGGLAALDAATGREVLRFKGSRDDKNAEILLRDGVLVERSGGGIRAFDAARAKLLWEKPDVFPGADAVLIGDGRVFYLHLDGRSSGLVSCDLRTGRERWRRDVGSLKNVVSLGLISYRSGTLLLSSSPRSHRFGHKDNKWSALYAFSAAEGGLLWKYEYEATPHFGRATNVLLRDDLVWIKLNAGKDDRKAAYTWVALDPKTGKEKKRVASTYNRCYPDRASARYIMTGDMDFLDPKTGSVASFKASRGSCNSAYMPANGLTYTFYITCNCFNFLRGLMSFSSGPVPASDPMAGRFEKGPAFGRAREGGASPGDWPTLRHDPARSGSTTAKVLSGLSGLSGLKVLWNTQVGKCTATSPVAAGGRVLVALTNEHRVVCLDAETGKVQWSYLAGGPIDSPPTIYKGLALVGCSDGWVYCLRARDGLLVWRFRAAPRDRRIVAGGQVESSWPVHGSVLVRDGTAYFAAGRHTHVDGGIHYYGADPKTGRILWQQQAGKAGGRFSDENVCEVLISDGEYIHLGQRVHFDPKTGAMGRASGKPVIFSMWGILKDNTLPGTGSGGMTFQCRPWAYTVVRTRAEPRGISWNHPLKGNLLVIDGDGVYGIVEQWRNTPRPRHRVWELFGRPSKGAKKWTLEVDYAHKPEALILAGRTLFFARRGVGGEGGEVWALSAEDGRKRGQISLPAAPRWDGMAAAPGRLFVSTQDGRVLCLGKR